MFISFNYVKSIYFILLFILLNSIITYTSTKLENDMKNLYISISKLSLLIFYLIQKKLNKNQSNQFFNSKIHKNQIINKEYMIIFCSVIFYFIYYYIYLFFKEQNYHLRKNSQFCLILFIDIIVFNNQRYSHQVISIIIISILSIFLFFFYFYIYQYYTFLFILSNYSYAFSLLLVKYINTKYFISVYIFGFIFSLIELILLLIKGISFQFNFNFLYKILFCFGLIGKYYLFYYIIYKLSLTHATITEGISILLPIMFITFLINWIIILSVTIIAIISGLIYLEIIELNFCDLNLNLKKNIYNRAKSEDKIILENMSDTDDEN